MSFTDDFLRLLYQPNETLEWLSTARSPIFEAMRDRYRCETDCRMPDWRDDANDWSPFPPDDDA